MKYIIATLGCKVNQYETGALETFLNERGHTRAEKGERADAVIVNTCAVTAESERKSRQTIHRLIEDNPEALLAVCGCYSQIAPEDIRRLGARIIYGTGERARLIDDLEAALASAESFENIDKPFERRLFEQLPAGNFDGRTRAMLKIQDGCVNFCTYCIIPYTRGRLRSLPIEAAERKAAELNTRGFSELVITGIEIASYGVDLPDKPDLADVISAVAAAAPDMRLRLGSIEPTVITEEFCEKLAAHENICRHFHLSLQSGCDAVLGAMNRKYDTARFFAATVLLRKYFPNCALTSDVIAGFPGETEEMHAETLAFLVKCAFAQIHAFPYSRRPGTPADKLPKQLPRAVKAARVRDIMAVSERTRAEYLKAQTGKTLPVLFETEERKNLWCGHSDTYILTEAAGENLRGIVKNVKIQAISDDILVGKVV